jgi:membrane-associated protease RseP (regulator of RpoE activity)
LLIVFLLNKKNVELQKIVFPLLYLVLYRTKFGLKQMDNIAKKHPKLVNFFGVLGIYFGFFGMAVIFYFLIKGTYTFLFLGGAPPVAPLLPGIKPAVGIPIISFVHWILAIFILAGVHEFSHGLVARLHNIKLKSSGFAVFSILLPIVPAAFVEPDEKELNKKSKKAQLSVLAAGSWSNFITAGVFLLISLFVMGPLVSMVSYDSGVVIVNVADGLPVDWLDIYC